jgi:glutathione S-transferase
VKLYSGPLSLFTAKVRIALAEKAIDYERIEVGWSLERRYEPHHPDVVARNPKREVPVLVDGEAVVYDSTLILEYLEERAPEPPLYPRDLIGRARCRQLEAAADELLFPFVWDLIEESFYPAAAAGRDELRLQRARDGVAGFCAARELDLAAGPYLVGDFSVADIGSFVFLNAATTLGAPVPEDLARMGAWQARVAERPAVAKEVAETGAFVARLLAR